VGAAEVARGGSSVSGHAARAVARMGSGCAGARAQSDRFERSVAADGSANRAVYAFEDDGTELAAATQAQAVYGMPELHRKEIAGARLVANPGCYATSVILPLKPLVAAGWWIWSMGLWPTRRAA